MDVIDVYRTFDAHVKPSGSDRQSRVLEIEAYSGNSQISGLDSGDLTRYAYSDGVNLSGVTSTDWGSNTVMINGTRTVQDNHDTYGTTSSGETFSNWFIGGVNPKHLMRLEVPQSQNVDAVIIYYPFDYNVPGVSIYKNSATPISGHMVTYTSPSNSSTSISMRYDFGETVPFNFGSPTITLTSTSTSNSSLGSTSSNRNSTVFGAKVSVTQSTTNTLFEFGGGIWGMACYVYNSTIYVQCGDGSTAGGDLELSYAIGAGETVTDITVSLSNSTVNLNKVDTGTLSSTSAVYGTNAGGMGQRHSAMCNTRMGTGSASTYTLTNGVITSLEAWGSDFINNS